ncbi:hypothetical protein ABE096_10875 [Robertmurraya massiliosenegalensis]|uniref:hypothetical protein n=1 Tax=Robertmurraya TaxID=2837507 RepID=UPI0039A475F9
MTFAFLIMFVGMLVLVALIDMFIWQESFLLVLFRLFSLDEGTNEGFVSGTAFVGLICSIVIDYRIKKNKGHKPL